MTKSPMDDEQAGFADAQDPSSASGDPAGFAGWTKEGAPPLPPLMQNPTASVAAAAALGFGMASHFAGFMLGAMQGFMEAAQKASATAEAEREAGQGKTPADTAEPAAGKAATSQPAPDVERGTVKAAGEPAADIAVDAAEATAAVIARASDAISKASQPKAEASPDSSGVKPARARRGKAADDLKQISGIGPKLEQVLKSFEITRFSEIAAWDENDIARFDRELNVSGRIVRDRWVEQAKVLAKG